MGRALLSVCLLFLISYVFICAGPIEDARHVRSQPMRDIGLKRNLQYNLVLRVFAFLSLGARERGREEEDPGNEVACNVM